MPVKIGILCFPGVQALDLAGPYDVFASAPGCTVQLVGKEAAPVRASTGLWLRPDLGFAEAPQFDLLCVPGGSGVTPQMGDGTVLDFLRAQAAGARWLTSVCTGSLLLGAAGLLRGKRAATHWFAMDFLERFGAIPVAERIVRDGALITAGGVTSGIDFGLAVLAELFGQDEAEAVQLMLEYAPAPPFDAGRPDRARDEILATVRGRLGASRAAREEALDQGAAAASAASAR